MTRVLYLIDGLGTGGAERSLAELQPGLAAAGIDVTIVCLNARAEGVQRQVLADGSDVRILGGGTVGQIRRLRHIVRTERPDLIHTSIFAASVVGRIASIGSPAIVLTSLVNTPYAAARLEDPGVRRLPLAAVRAVDIVTARTLTDHFHAITHAVADWAVLDMKLDPSRITVIERGRDPERLGTADPARRATVRRRLTLAEDAEVVIAVGRQEFQKGQRHLLEAVERILPAHPRLVVMLAGRKGATTSELERIAARPGLRDAVRFLGHRDDVPDLLAASDVFAFPSRYEGLGGSVIEAMALGLPIVASDIPAVREIVEEGRNAVLVPPGDSASLASALDGILRDPSRRRAFGARGRTIFEERFTLERSTARMIALYERLIGDGSARLRTGSPSEALER
jgi:glycosyltransferase involved in cell wall biosynthesis